MVASHSIGCDGLDSLDLKVLLLAEGIYVHEEVYTAFGSAHHISPDPLECSVLYLPDGTVVHIANIGPKAPFHLTLGPEGRLQLLRAGEFVTEVSLPKATGFYQQRTSRGVPFRGLAVLQGHDVLAFPYLWPCEFAKAGQACKFCKYQCSPPGDMGFNVCLCRDTWDHRTEILSLTPSQPQSACSANVTF